MINIRIYRKVITKYSTVYIELGHFFEIQISRRFVEDFIHSKSRQKDWPKGILKVLKEGSMIPSWYGFAYFDYYKDCAVYAPIPINLLLASSVWFRENIWYRVKFEWPHKLNIRRKDGLRASK